MPISTVEFHEFISPIIQHDSARMDKWNRTRILQTKCHRMEIKKNGRIRKLSRWINILWIIKCFNQNYYAIDIFVNSEELAG